MANLFHLSFLLPFFFFLFSTSSFFAQFIVFLTHGISAGLLSRPHAIHWINLYPLNNTVGVRNAYLVDSDLYGGKRYPCFDQLVLGKKEFLPEKKSTWVVKNEVENVSRFFVCNYEDWSGFPKWGICLQISVLPEFITWKLNHLITRNLHRSIYIMTRSVAKRLKRGRILCSKNKKKRHPDLDSMIALAQPQYFKCHASRVANWECILSHGY